MSNRMRRSARRVIALLALMSPAAGYGAHLQGSLGVGSDNVFRGYSLSDGQFSPLADLHVSQLHWFGGVAVDAVRLEPRVRTGAQLIAYLGYQRTFQTDWSGELGARHYDYPGDVFRARYDYEEYDATLGWRDRLSLRLIGSPDTYQAALYRAGYYRYGRGRAFAGELSGRQPLASGFAAQLGVGYYDLQRQVRAGYWYWSVGLTKQWDAWSLSVTYIGTDATARRLFGTRAGERVVGTVVWSF
jgi:uncharacterized protein (TIGR02001 family)